MFIELLPGTRIIPTAGAIQRHGGAQGLVKDCDGPRDTTVAAPVWKKLSSAAMDTVSEAVHERACSIDTEQAWGGYMV